LQGSDLAHEDSSLARNLGSFIATLAGKRFVTVARLLLSQTFQDRAIDKIGQLGVENNIDFSALGIRTVLVHDYARCAADCMVRNVQARS
jgi:hypothetical protein